MPDYFQLTKKENKSCLVCNSKNQKILGIRGNREFTGYNPDAKPHIFTNVVECNNCGFIFTNPIIVGAHLLEDAHYSSESSYKTSNAISIDNMFNTRIKLIKKFKLNGQVLDVGSGKGEFLDQLRKQGFNSQGIEPSKGLYEYSLKTYKSECYNGVIENFSTINKFDVITAIHSLEHMDDPHSFLTKAHHLLDSTGILFIEVPNTKSIFLKIIDLFFRLKGLKWSSRLSPLHPPFHKYGYNKSSLNKLLEINQFRVIKIKTLSGSDRGYDPNKNIPLIWAMARNLASLLINSIGNREILVAIAMPIRK